MYSAGKFGHFAVNDLIENNAYIIGICDDDVNEQGDNIQGNLIFDFETLLNEYKKYENYIVVAANNAHWVHAVIT